MVKYRNKHKPKKNHPWKTGKKGFKSGKSKLEQDFTNYVIDNYKNTKKKNAGGRYLGRQKHERGAP